MIGDCFCISRPWKSLLWPPHENGQIGPSGALFGPILGGRPFGAQILVIWGIFWPILYFFTICSRVFANFRGAKVSIKWGAFFFLTHFKLTFWRFSRVFNRFWGRGVLQENPRRPQEAPGRICGWRCKTMTISYWCPRLF